MKTPTQRCTRAAPAVPPAAADAGAVHCPATAELASLICDDTMAVIELLSKLVGDGVECACELAAARVQLARAGMLADRVRLAHANPPHVGWHREPLHWLLIGAGSDESHVVADAWASLAARSAP